jgi:hypothetical protein
MTKDQLKQLHFGSWYAECIDFLEPEFFNPDKQIRFLGESRYYKLEPLVVQSPPTLMEKITDEIVYRQKRMKIIPADELNRIYLEETLRMSREREDKLIRKMTARNSAVGDIDKAKQYPIDQLIKFRGGFAKCIWHEEKTASMKYYEKTNSVHCFSCGKSGDAIDVCRQINNCSFKEAIKKLT